MDQTILIPILVGLVVLLLGVLLLLMVASFALFWWSRAPRRAPHPGRRAPTPRAAPVAPIPAPEPFTPTPISRVARPDDFAFDAVAADEAATEVMSANHVKAFFDQDETTGATDMHAQLGDAAFDLEETEDTTQVGPARGGS